MKCDQLMFLISCSKLNLTKVTMKQKTTLIDIGEDIFLLHPRTPDCEKPAQQHHFGTNNYCINVYSK